MTTSAFDEAACSGSRPHNSQPCELYSEANHGTWQQLYGQMRDPWASFANDRFLEGLENLNLPENRVPRLDQVNAFLAPRTGFLATAASGYVPAFDFFDGLRNHKLATAISIRDAAALDCLPVRDIFHDVAGHVPMHADRSFAQVLVALGDCARTAVEIACSIRDTTERLRRLTSIVKAMARYYWFTLEFGLMRCGDHLKAYGSGLLSSANEIEHAIVSPRVQRCELHLDWVIHQSFETHHYQPLLFVVESFDQLHQLTATLERWMKEGRLDHVSGGSPDVSAADLESFLKVCGSRRSSPWRASNQWYGPVSHRERSDRRRLPANRSHTA